MSEALKQLLSRGFSRVVWRLSASLLSQRSRRQGGLAASCKLPFTISMPGTPAPET